MEVKSTEDVELSSVKCCLSYVVGGVNVNHLEGKALFI